MIAVVASNLSAIGSKNFPRSVTWLFFLAKYPSRKSLKTPNVKIIQANNFPKLYGIKSAKYAAAGVREYWIVDIKNDRVLNYEIKKQLR